MSALRKFIDALARLFEKALEQKTSWGRTELILLFRECVKEALLEVMDDVGTDS